MNPLVSIVTPVYNEAQHLGECIESILAQTYKNWDYTILDNCSVDSSITIARRYAAVEPRIRVVENCEFLPVVRNHNVALRLVSAECKYCKVVFADDWIFPECLEKMVSVGEQHPSVGIVGAYGLQGSKVMWQGLAYPSSCVAGREVGRRHFVDPLYEFGSASSLLFRSDLVRNTGHFYNEANFHADIEAILVNLKQWDFGFVHQVLCFSRERPQSLSSLSSGLATFKGAMLHDLIVHGPAFLGSEEFEAVSNRALDDYYNFLAVNALVRHDALFWEYHKKVLSGVGLGFSRIRLARALAVRLFKGGLNPTETVAKVLQKISVKSGRGKLSTSSSEIEAILRQPGR